MFRKDFENFKWFFKHFYFLNVKNFPFLVKSFPRNSKWYFRKYQCVEVRVIHDCKNPDPEYASTTRKTSSPFQQQQQQQQQHVHSFAKKNFADQTYFLFRPANDYLSKNFAEGSSFLSLTLSLSFSLFLSLKHSHSTSFSHSLKFTDSLTLSNTHTHTLSLPFFLTCSIFLSIFFSIFCPLCFLTVIIFFVAQRKFV